MKIFVIICVGLLFASLTILPVGYYTFLRIIVTISAFLIIYNEFKNGINFWIISFGIIFIIFNPIITIYLHDKNIWTPIDLVVYYL